MRARTHRTHSFLSPHTHTLFLTASHEASPPPPPPHTHTHTHTARRGPYVFSPQLLLSELEPTLLGWLYGLNKREATSFPRTAADGTTAIYVDPAGASAPILRAARNMTLDESMFASPDAFPHFAALGEAMAAPLIGVTPIEPASSSGAPPPLAKGYLCSTFDWNLTTASMAPVIGGVAVADINSFRLDAGGAKVAAIKPLAGLNLNWSTGIDRDAFGAFELRTEWSMTEPLPCEVFNTSKRKVLILGGGLGGMTAAWYLSSSPRFDITLMTLGHRLGGKTASGREVEDAETYGHRSYEHGLHVFMGFYNNAFELIKETTENFRADGTGSWTDLFLAAADVTLAFNPSESSSNASSRVASAVQSAGAAASRVVAAVQVLVPDLVPGTSPGGHHVVPSLFELFADLVKLAKRIIDDGEARADAQWLRLVLAHLAEVPTLNTTRDDTTALGAITRAHAALHSAGKTYRRRAELDPNAAPKLSPRTDTSAKQMGQLLYESLDLMLALAGGMLRDGVLNNGFRVIDHLEMCTFLTNNGMTENPFTTPIVSAGYDLVFGFKDGDPTKPHVAAGAATFGLMMMLVGGELLVLLFTTHTTHQHPHRAYVLYTVMHYRRPRIFLLQV